MKCVKCNKIFNYQTYSKQSCNECKAEDKLIRDEKKKQERNSAEYKERKLSVKEEARRKILENNVLQSRLKYSDESDPNEYVECGICGFRTNNLGTHLKIHNITGSEHKEKYGPVVSVNAIEKIKGENNPAYNHGGRLSPFSKKFINYTSDEAISELVKTATKSRNDNDNCNAKLSYYTKRGAALEEAAQLLSERQTTFSLEKCIEKHGEIKGLIVWQERQDKWQNSLESKPQEEKDKMNKLKSTKYSFQELWGNTLDSPGSFYILELTPGIYKIGITSKPKLNQRHGFLNKKSNKIKVKYFEPTVDINHAFRIEQLVKRKFIGAILKENSVDTPDIGWTEVIKTDYESIMTEAYKYINDAELSISDFAKLRESIKNKK